MDKDKRSDYSVTKVTANFNSKDLINWAGITAFSIPFGYFIGLFFIKIVFYKN